MRRYERSVDRPRKRQSHWFVVVPASKTAVPLVFGSARQSDRSTTDRRLLLMQGQRQTPDWRNSVRSRYNPPVFNGLNFPVRRSAYVLSAMYLAVTIEMPSLSTRMLRRALRVAAECSWLLLRRAQTATVANALKMRLRAPICMSLDLPARIVRAVSPGPRRMNVSRSAVLCESSGKTRPLCIIEVVITRPALPMVQLPECQARNRGKTGLPLLQDFCIVPLTYSDLAGCARLDRFTPLAVRGKAVVQTEVLNVEIAS